MVKKSVVELPEKIKDRLASLPVNGKRQVPIDLLPIRIGTMKVRLVGTGSLIVHNFDEKCRDEIEAKQGGKPKDKKAPKNPADCFERSKYKTKDGHDGFPAANFKKAAVWSARYLDDLKQTDLRGAFFVEGENIPLELPVPTVMRRDYVRVGGMNKVADLRYRAEYPEWAVVLDISYNEAAITPQVILNLLHVAGFSCGVGERRPQKEGTRHGTWRLDEDFKE